MSDKPSGISVFALIIAIASAAFTAGMWQTMERQTQIMGEQTEILKIHTQAATALARPMLSFSVQSVTYPKGEAILTVGEFSNVGRLTGVLPIVKTKK